jgi:uncharacterized membrane protein YtjA (UPF0391 family)
MLNWALTFLVVAIIAGVLGFSGVAGAASQIAQILFFVFLVLLIVSAWQRPCGRRGQSSRATAAGGAPGPDWPRLVSFPRRVRALRGASGAGCLRRQPVPWPADDVERDDTRRPLPLSFGSPRAAPRHPSMSADPRQVHRSHRQRLDDHALGPFLRFSAPLAAQALPRGQGPRPAPRALAGRQRRLGPGERSFTTRGGRDRRYSRAVPPTACFLVR